MGESIPTNSVPLLASFSKYKAGTEVEVLNRFDKNYKGFKYYYLILVQGLEFFVTPDFIDKEAVKKIDFISTSTKALEKEELQAEEVSNFNAKLVIKISENETQRLLSKLHMK